MKIGVVWVESSKAFLIGSKKLKFNFISLILDYLILFSSFTKNSYTEQYLCSNTRGTNLSRAFNN